jgi:hypothetical protein
LYYFYITHIICDWSIEGYQFEAFRAVVDNHIVVLAIDNHIQNMQIETRLDTWLEDITEPLLSVYATDSN